MFFLLLAATLDSFSQKPQWNPTSYEFINWIYVNGKLRIPRQLSSGADTGTIAYQFGRIWVKDSTGDWVPQARLSEVGISLSNLGGGYRLYSPGGSGVKTLFPGSGVTFDSTTNPNGITITAAGGGGGADNRQKAMYFPEPTFGSNINHGYYFYETMEFGSGTYEFWIRPEIGAEYVISDGYGGSHVVLFGVDGCVDGRCGLGGNSFVGYTNAVSLISKDRFDANTRHHIAVVFDYNAGTNTTAVRTYIDGVPTYKNSFSGKRKNVLSEGCGIAYIGGSDHSNYRGTIFRGRFVEGVALYGDSPFYPQHVFDNTIPNVSLAFDYTDKVNPTIDRSYGFYGLKHDGRPLARQGDFYPQVGVSPDSIPHLIADSIYQSPYTGSITSASGAKIEDYFERTDQVPAFMAPALDSTAASGTLGKKAYGAYIHDQNSFSGIIDGKCYFTPELQSYRYVEGNSSDQDVRITIASSSEIDCYVIARYLAYNNRIYARLTGTNLVLWQATPGGGFVNLGSASSITDSDIRLVVSGTTATVYTGGVSRISATVTSTTSNYSGFGANSSYTRIDDFKVF